MPREKINVELDRKNLKNHNDNYEVLFNRLINLEDSASDLDIYMTEQDESWVI